MKIHFLRNVWHNGFFKNKVNVLRYFSGHAIFYNKTGMFVYCITDMTVTLIKNPPKNYSDFQFQCSNDVCCKQSR
jgi:hypothetical protein